MSGEPPKNKTADAFNAAAQPKNPEPTKKIDVPATQLNRNKNEIKTANVPKGPTPGGNAPPSAPMVNQEAAKNVVPPVPPRKYEDYVKARTGEAKAAFNKAALHGKAVASFNHSARKR